MKIKRIVGIVFFLMSLVGVACGLWGLTNNKIKVSGQGYSGVYDLEEKSYSGKASFKMDDGGFVLLKMDAKEKAYFIKNCRIWGGFVSAALYAFIGIFLILKTRRQEVAKKKIVGIAMVCALMLQLMMSCGGRLNGSYTSYSGGALTFDGDKMTKEIIGIPVEGTYRIEGDKLIFTYKPEDLRGLAEVYGLKGKAEYQFTKGWNTVVLDNNEYTKTKKK